MIKNLPSVLVVALLLSSAPYLCAQSYPNQAISLVIPLAPGDASDIAGLQGIAQKPGESHHSDPGAAQPEEVPACDGERICPPCVHFLLLCHGRIQVKDEAGDRGICAELGRIRLLVPG